jgi:hypothetical protein
LSIIRAFRFAFVPGNAIEKPASSSISHINLEVAIISFNYLPHLLQHPDTTSFPKQYWFAYNAKGGSSTSVTPSPQNILDNLVLLLLPGRENQSGAANDVASQANQGNIRSRA